MITPSDENHFSNIEKMYEALECTGSSSTERGGFECGLEN
jgi:hypothetical protein